MSHTERTEPLICDNKTAIISGATSGIGLATTLIFLDAGYKVHGCSRSGVVNESVQSHKNYQNYVNYVCDVGDPEKVKAFVNEVSSNSDNIDVLVNCAGVSGGGKITDITDELWSNIINVNLNGTFFLTREVLRKFDVGESGNGRIISVASTAGKQGVLLATPYTASKHGVVGFMKSLSLELASQGITANAVCPGYVETPMAQRIRQSHADYWGVTEADILGEFNKKIPLGRYSNAHEVASMIFFLTTANAASVTGQAINVCGGLGRY